MSIVQMLLTGNGYTPGSQTYATAGSYTWTCPAGVTSVTVECIGGGGRGFQYEYGTSNGGGGGGGGGYAKSVRSVSPGSSYSLYVGGSEEDSWFISTATVLGTAGGRGPLDGGGTGGSGSGGTGFQLSYSGGAGGAKSSDYYNYYGGGGGGGASSSGAGSGGSGQSGGAGGSGGPSGNGGAGGSFATSNSGGVSGAPGTDPGGGGGGRSAGDFYNNYSLNGGTGAAGQIKLTW
jgi:hypothetical protein